MSSASIINHLIVEVSDSPSFATHSTEVVDPRVASFPVSGLPNTTKYVRAKYQRTAAVGDIPADESGYSETLIIVFPDCGAASGCCGDAEPPVVPIIQAIYGWTDFIEVVMLTSTALQGSFEAWYAEPFAAGGGMKAGLYVKNTSLDPSIGITQVDYLIGNNYVGCAGFTSFFLDALDPSPLLSPRTTFSANFGTSDTGDPGTPKIGVDYNVELLGLRSDKIGYKSVGTGPDFVCPQDVAGNGGIAEGYWCQTIYSGARLSLTDFNQGIRGVQPQILVQVYARAAVLFIDALGRTIFEPYLPASPSGGWYGSFQGNVAPPAAKIKVTFSTGAVVEQDAVALGVGKTGLVWTAPVVDSSFALDDYFVFISETSFTDTLDQLTNRWEDVLFNGLPQGVFLAIIARSSNMMVSNLAGVRLDPAKTYFFRVGARRFTSFKQAPPDYMYSETLSEIQQGRVRSSLADSNLGEPPASNILDDAGDKVKILKAGTGIKFVADPLTEKLTISIDTDKVRESSGWVWVVAGTAAIATNVCAEYTADFTGTFKTWILKTHPSFPPTGASLIVDVTKNGVSIFADGVNRPTLTSGQVSASGVVFNTPAFVTGDVFRMDVDQIGSTAPGTRVELELTFDSPLRIL